ncbi:MAG TPA: hypothetical protein VFJ89_14750 [Nocardioides sp.]|jgi:hypothetical protein|nr:hypothetical protein [Nocardioides sp.]
MGGTRVVALALLLPIFGLPAAASASPHHPRSAAHATARPVAADPARGTARDTGRTAHRDAVVRTRTPSARTTTAARLSSPPSIHLLAARLYWGHRPPAYPSRTEVHRDLHRTADYFDRVSRGREKVQFTLTRWVHVDASRTTMCNRQQASARAARRALGRAGYHVARFNRLMLLTEQCHSAASVAQLPGTLSWIRFRHPGMATLVHELGHNLGLEHAYGVVCTQGGRRVPLGGACHTVEYGDSWDAMGHSNASFAAPALARLGWSGRTPTVGHAGTFDLADVEHARGGSQALRIPLGGTTYWVEYQPEHSPQVGRSIPGVTVRRELANGRVQIIDASPGNATGIAYPDADLTNAALPVGSSLTLPGGLRITTVDAGRRTASVRVGFGEHAAAPDAPDLSYAARLHNGSYRVHWTAPADNGQVVLGYRVTDQTSGTSTYVTSPAGYRTTAVVPAPPGGDVPTFTVAAVNQVGWSAASAPMTGRAYGPVVTVTSPVPGSTVDRDLNVNLTARPDAPTRTPPAKAWAVVGGVTCSTQVGAGPYVLRCAGAPTGQQTLTVSVQNTDGVVSRVTVPIVVAGP